MNSKLVIALILLSSLIASCSSPKTAEQQNASNTQSSANAQATPTKALPEDVVKVEAQKVEVKAGEAAQAGVRLTIKEGYHINGNPPSQYQIATQLTAEQADGVTGGEPTYPPSISKKFQFSEQPLAVYEKEAMINLPVSATASAAKGERQLPAKLRFQACDDLVCYPPKILKLTVPVTVK